MTTDVDIVIIGGGLVGTSLALALGKSGLKLALVEAKTAEPLAVDAADWDSRIYAITPGNAEFLSRLGIWGGLDKSRISPIHSMQVWGDNTENPLVFDAYAAGVAELGYIIESRLMQNALWEALKSRQEVEVICPARCASLQFNQHEASLTLEDGRKITSKLIVAADGSNSWVLAQAGVEVDAQPYHQLGVVANFETELPHDNIARQWFREDGILAWLPMPGRRISVVWSAFEAKANALLQLPVDAFCHAVAEAGNQALGTLRIITPAVGFPLVSKRNQSMIAPRLAMVGDAAHQIHPLAGQGMNLGLRDAQSLAEILLKEVAKHQLDVGNEVCLRRYARARKSDVAATGGMSDGLQKLFKNQNPLVGFLRNTGLRAVNHCPPIKRALMAQALI